MLIKYQRWYEVNSTIKNECFQVLPKILKQMKEDSFDDDMLQACDAILNENDDGFTTKFKLQRFISCNELWPIVTLEHELVNQSRFNIRLYLSEPIEVITDYRLPTGWGAQLEWPDIGTIEELVQLSQKINKLNGDLVDSIAYFNCEIKVTDKVNVDDAPDDIKKMLYVQVVTDFLANGFAVERIQDAEHLAEIINKCETEFQESLRLLIKEFTSNQWVDTRIDQLFSKDNADWPMPRTILSNMQVLIEVIDNSDNHTDQQFTAQSAMLQILATQFERLEHTEKLSAYYTMTSNPAFNKNVLDEHYEFNRFAVHHEREIAEFNSCHQLANLIDNELQNITAVENEVRQSDDLSVQNAL
ncbi:hypothetical protein [Shewanella aestuarii]|uniref:Uncharacterized protein n=1 Tax=Shewanella aestuarii TaxID=1028752 RepID=A0A6G9QPR3_9GAMM|nr:hypothetical protein [Shewanella aestuarii]QIR16580.1 hypothetical protein HBH39_19080 [Shewanella aestuarii]